MKNNKGITLIALVVTIIVLLILAGVSIAMLSGDNGILKNAQLARDKSAAGTLEEATKIAVGNILTDNLEWPYSEEKTTTGEDGKTTTSTVLTAKAGENGATAITDLIAEIKKVNDNITAAQDGDVANNTVTLKATIDGKEQKVKVNLLTGAVTK